VNDKEEFEEMTLSWLIKQLFFYKVKKVSTMKKSMYKKDASIKKFFVLIQINKKIDFKLILVLLCLIW